MRPVSTNTSSNAFSPGGAVEVGLFGKLPSRGDFVRRRVADAFVDAWDAWLRECLAASRDALGDRWLDIYLTSPAWRFALSAGTCGPVSVIGLMVPSVDRAGRYFPLTLVANLPPDVDLIAAALGSTPFFERAERLMIDTLAIDTVDFDRFDEQVVALANTLDPIMLPPRLILDRTAASMLHGTSQSSQIQIGSIPNLGLVFQQLLAQRLATLYRPWTLWWSDGSAVVEPSCLVAQGLPAADMFVALLDGTFDQHRWRPVPAIVDLGATVEMHVEDTAVSLRSAAASDVGLTRKVNQDAFIERTEVGLWAVADGLGGHRDGEIASHMVCDSLAELVPDPTFEGAIESARRQLQGVNDYLLRASPHAALADRSASTVALLLIRGSNCAVLWAGDSRVYRCRAGKLERMTQDHSAGDGAETTSAITRAVGVEDRLVLDLRREKVAPGDRFLLCSDGLTRTVPEPEIEALMNSKDIDEAVRGLIGATLTAGAPDNVTVLIAEAYTYAQASANSLS